MNGILCLCRSDELEETRHKKSTKELELARLDAELAKRSSAHTYFFGFFFFKKKSLSSQGSTQSSLRGPVPTLTFQVSHLHCKSHTDKSHTYIASLTF